MLKPARDVGIVGYGAYVPRYRLPASEVARVWTDGTGGLPIKEKAVAGLDEDTLSMSIEAARECPGAGADRSGVDPGRVGGQRVAPVRGQAHVDHRG